MPHTNFFFLGSMGLIAQFMRFTSRRTGLVTPAIVRLPSTTPVLSGLIVTLVDLYVISGNSMTLRKSGDRRWSSRLLKPVLTDAASGGAAAGPGPGARAAGS